MTGRIESHAGQTVLVADDDPDIVALLDRRLTRSGYRVLTACDGSEALQMAQDHLPDLVVLDVMMPKLTGFEVTQQLRARPETRDILVVLISGAFRDEEISGLLDGADEYVSKPFGSQEIPDRVHAALAR